MAKRIAVQEDLHNVIQALRDSGFEVTKLTEGTMANVDAAVITGLGENFLGIHDTQGNRFPVINASGMTAEEVVGLVQSRVRLQHER